MTKKCRFCGEPTTEDWKMGMFTQPRPPVLRMRGHHLPSVLLAAR